MSISSQEFRDALRHFPSGVTIVTIKTGEKIHGLTVSAFTSVSPEPPLIAIVIDQRHRAFSMLEEAGASFAVNILHQDQASLAERFAWVKDEDRFAEGTWTTAATGAPILADALAWLDCTLISRHQAGTHTIYVGEVQASGVPRSDEPPLIYWNRSYRRLAKKSIKKPAPITDKQEALMDKLLELKCTACRGDEPPLGDGEIAALLPQVPGWKVVERDGIKRLEHGFTWRNFVQALTFTNRIGALAEAEGHHPALLTEWGRVTVTWWTHKIKGLHRNDFIMAAKTSEMYSQDSPPVVGAK